MRELQRKQTIKRRLYSTPVLLALALVTLLLVKGAYGVIEKERTSSIAVKDLAAKVGTLSAQEIELKSEITRLNTEAGLAEAIKEKFNVSAVGEHVAVIVDPHPVATSTASSSSSWYKRFWDAIISAL